MEMTSSRSARVTLPTDTQILIEREFDAPAQLVFRAYTEPELVRRWWTGGCGEMTVAEIDLRVGGRWRYAMATPDGSESAFHGEYREIVPGERIVSTEVYEPFPDAAALDTVTFEGRAGRTLLTILIEHTRKEHRDAHIESGMEEGLQDALDLLERVAAGVTP
jgi:uncharacterized protein YndB with AHSA1/START domain